MKMHMLRLETKLSPSVEKRHRVHATHHGGGDRGHHDDEDGVELERKARHDDDDSQELKELSWVHRFSFLPELPIVRLGYRTHEAHMARRTARRTCANGNSAGRGRRGGRVRRRAPLSETVTAPSPPATRSVIWANAPSPLFFSPERGTRHIDRPRKRDSARVDIRSVLKSPFEQTARSKARFERGGDGGRPFSPTKAQLARRTGGPEAPKRPPLRRPLRSNGRFEHRVCTNPDLSAVRRRARRRVRQRALLEWAGAATGADADGPRQGPTPAHGTRVWQTLLWKPRGQSGRRGRPRRSSHGIQAADPCHHLGV